MRIPDFNAPECDCPYLETLSRDPAAPIEFDAKFNEYHILGTNGARHMVYHCPFCGGRTPKSRRHELFTPDAHAERQRLNRRHFRTLTYKNLSAVADVEFLVGVNDQVWFTLMPKSIDDA